MRALVAIIVIFIILGFAGWITFSTPNGEPTLRVDTNKVKEDTSAIVEKSKELTHQAVDQVEDATDGVDETYDRGTITTEPR